ncbi:hypothetical protein [Rhodococcus erythropolis]|uniref:hypothetical protein n=1 Tax=Rhodococcus erythropolis TaxID=1833 RepID=UPI00366DFA97
MTESRIEKLTRIGQEMAAAVAEMRAEAVDLTPDLTTELANRQIEGETAWWRSIDFDRNASRTFESLTGDSQQAVRTGVERVLAELQSTGHLIPAGGMALTAEQVEDVRTVAGEDEELAMTGEFWAARDRLRALFPATEPAEEPAEERCRKWTMRVVGGIETGIQCVLPAGHECFHDYVPPIRNYVQPAPAEPTVELCAEPTVTGIRCDRKKGHPGEHRLAKWGPVEPAEEETKAAAFDLNALVRQLAQAGWRERERGESIAGEPCIEWDTQLDWQQQIEYQVVRRILAELKRLGLLTLPAASPVVPAPTETGPWQRIEDVPESVGRLTDRDGDIWEWDGDNWVTPETAILPTTYINRKYAPFVAAEEG